MYGILKDDETEAQPSFKIGDRVRVVKGGLADGGSCHGADVGFVCQIDGWDGEYFETDSGWYFKPHELAPAFLPDDKVRVTKHSGYFAVGDIGEVERQSDSVVFVKHGSYQRVGLPIDVDSLELIAEPEAGNNEQLQPWLLGEWEVQQPCIVARIYNGQPRPSNVPFVHPNSSSATTEAERLAKNNPGQEFAVYQRVAGRVAEVSYTMKEVA
jgi:hypothetical protein